MKISVVAPGALLFLTLASSFARAEWRLDIEAGALWADHNDVQIPNDDQGDRFDIADFGRDRTPQCASRWPGGPGNATNFNGFWCR